MKSNLMNFELTSEILSVPTPGVRNAKRFQVIVEYAAGFCVISAVAESPEEAVEFFLVQAPGYEEGEITLYDRDKQSAVASVKWKMETTEIGLRVPRRQNVFRDWHLALIALEVQKRRSEPALVELNA